MTVSGTPSGSASLASTSIGLFVVFAARTTPSSAAIGGVFGGGLAPTKVYRSAADAADVPAGVVTRTSTVPTAPAGLVTTTWVAVALTIVPAAAPNSTAVAPARFVPVTV